MHRCWQPPSTVEEKTCYALMIFNFHATVSDYLVLRSFGEESSAKDWPTWNHAIYIVLIYVQITANWWNSSNFHNLFTFN